MCDLGMLCCHYIFAVICDTLVITWKWYGQKSQKERDTLMVPPQNGYWDMPS